MGMIYCFHHDGYVDTNDDAEVIYPDGTLETGSTDNWGCMSNRAKALSKISRSKV